MPACCRFRDSVDILRATQAQSRPASSLPASSSLASSLPTRAEARPCTGSVAVEQVLQRCGHAGVSRSRLACSRPASRHDARRPPLSAAARRRPAAPPAGHPGHPAARRAAAASSVGSLFGALGASLLSASRRPAVLALPAPCSLLSSAPSASRSEPHPCQVLLQVAVCFFMHASSVKNATSAEWDWGMQKHRRSSITARAGDGARQLACCPPGRDRSFAQPNSTLDTL